MMSVELLRAVIAYQLQKMTFASHILIWSDALFVERSLIVSQMLLRTLKLSVSRREYRK